MLVLSPVYVPKRIKKSSEPIFLSLDLSLSIKKEK